MELEYQILVWMVVMGLTFVLGYQWFLDFMEPNKSAQIFSMAPLLLTWGLMSLGIGATTAWTVDKISYTFLQEEAKQK